VEATVSRSLLAAALSLSLIVPAAPARAEHAVTTPVDERALAELRDFTTWLSENDAEGFVGEVGWPGGEHRRDADHWNHLAEMWLDEADAARLWVAGWAAGEWWPEEYPLAMYTSSTDAHGVDTPSTQASVLEQHLAPPRRGINVAGAEFAAPSDAATSNFSNENPGVYDIDYHYESLDTFKFLASRGIRMVRIPFRWERLQPRLGEPLSRAEVQRLMGAVHRAGEAGLDVVLDMHNYGAYYLEKNGEGVRRAVGTRACSAADLVDVWRRLSKRFSADPVVVGYGVMNEPIGIPETARAAPAERWERMSQRVLNGIRARGDRTMVLISGYNWSAVHTWREQHPTDWIVDPLDRFRYEAHHYWDHDRSGKYKLTYEEEVARSQP